MTKDDATRKRKRKGKVSSDSKARKKQNEDQDEESGSESIELQAVKSKKGEPDDNLQRRAEWFQKRTGG